MDNKIKSALDAAGTAADYSARATYQRGFDAGVASVDEFWKSRDTESQCAIGDARYEAEAAEAREWALGVQVVAQAARLRLAESTIGALRDISEQDCPYSDNCPVFGSNHGTCEGCEARRALAAWDTVPGMEP
jgi:hypothetical protein